MSINIHHMRHDTLNVLFIMITAPALCFFISVIDQANIITTCSTVSTITIVVTVWIIILIRGRMKVRLIEHVRDETIVLMDTSTSTPSPG